MTNGEIVIAALVNKNNRTYFNIKYKILNSDYTVKISPVDLVSSNVQIRNSSGIEDVYTFGMKILPLESPYESSFCIVCGVYCYGLQSGYSYTQGSDYIYVFMHNDQGGSTSIKASRKIADYSSNFYSHLQLAVKKITSTSYYISTQGNQNNVGGNIFTLTISSSSISLGEYKSDIGSRPLTSYPLNSTSWIISNQVSGTTTDCHTITLYTSGGSSSVALNFNEYTINGYSFKAEQIDSNIIFCTFVF